MARRQPQRGCARQARGPARGRRTTSFSSSKTAPSRRRFRGSPDSPVSLCPHHRFFRLDFQAEAGDRRRCHRDRQGASARQRSHGRSIRGPVLSGFSLYPVSKVDFSFLDWLAGSRWHDVYDNPFSQRRGISSPTQVCAKGQMTLSDGEDNASHVSKRNSFWGDGTAWRAGGLCVSTFQSTYSCKMKRWQGDNMKFLAEEGGGIYFYLDPDPHRRLPISEPPFERIRVANLPWRPGGATARSISWSSGSRSRTSGSR